MPKDIHPILTEKLACFLPGRAKDLSAPLYLAVRGDYTKGVECFSSCTVKVVETIMY